MNTADASWLTFLPFFTLLVGGLVTLGFLWLAVRVVRHAWYWQRRSERLRN
jgi:hypothetical protein